jgi:hypothetical protein
MLEYHVCQMYSQYSFNEMTEVYGSGAYIEFSRNKLPMATPTVSFVVD